MNQLFHPVLVLIPSDLTFRPSHPLFQPMGLCSPFYRWPLYLSTLVPLGKVAALNPTILLYRLPNFNPYNPTLA